MVSLAASPPVIVAVQSSSCKLRNSMDCGRKPCTMSLPPGFAPHSSSNSQWRYPTSHLLIFLCSILPLIFLTSGLSVIALHLVAKWWALLFLNLPFGTQGRVVEATRVLYRNEEQEKRPHVPRELHRTCLVSGVERDLDPCFSFLNTLSLLFTPKLFPGTHLMSSLRRSSDTSKALPRCLGTKSFLPSFKHLQKTRKTLDKTHKHYREMRKSRWLAKAHRMSESLEEKLAVSVALSLAMERQTPVKTLILSFLNHQRTEAGETTEALESDGWSYWGRKGSRVLSGSFTIPAWSWTEQRKRIDPAKGKDISWGNQHLLETECSQKTWITYSTDSHPHHQTSVSKIQG